MAAQIGMPVGYRDNSGNIWPAQVCAVSDGVVAQVTYFMAGSGLTSVENSPASGFTQDNTLSTDNSWAEITFTASASVTVTSGD